MNPEKITWPDEAQWAAMVTFNLDAEHFLHALHPDAKLAGSLPETVTEGSLKARMQRVLEILAQRDVKSTFFVPGIVAESHPELVRMASDEGHEIGVRGYAAENLALLPVEEQAELIERSVRAVADACGKRPRGFRMPDGEITKATLRLARRAGLTYSSSLSDDDRPYSLDLGDGESIVEIPIHWALSDMPYLAFNFWPPVPYGQDRIACFRHVLTNWQWECDAFREEGLCCALQLNPYTIGEPGHAFMLEKILDHILVRGNAWMPTGSAVEDYFRSLG